MTNWVRSFADHPSGTISERLTWELSLGNRRRKGQQFPVYEKRPIRRSPNRFSTFSFNCPRFHSQKPSHPFLIRLQHSRLSAFWRLRRLVTVNYLYNRQGSSLCSFFFWKVFTKNLLKRCLNPLEQALCSVQKSLLVKRLSACLCSFHQKHVHLFLF